MISDSELESGVRDLGLSVSKEQRATLLEYLQLLQKWNQVYNLTAIREEEKLLPYHLLDSLSVTPHIVGHRLIDIGTGAGLPGIPLAVARPDLHVVLLDSSHKKTTFLRQATAELRLSNVEVITERAEAYQPPGKFDAAISRAFSDLKTFVDVARHLIRPSAMLLAMKGLYPNEELEQLPSYAVTEKIVRLNVPGLTNAERHLVILRCAEMVQ